jgi:hypothetical protein
MIELEKYRDDELVVRLSGLRKAERGAGAVENLNFFRHEPVSVQVKQESDERQNQRELKNIFRRHAEFQLIVGRKVFEGRIE